MTTKPLAEQSPVEIDTQLAALYEAEQKALAAYGAAMASVYHAAGAKRVYLARGTKWSLTKVEAIAKVEAMLNDEDETPWRQRDAKRALEGLDERALALHEIRQQAEVFNAEFERRGGWTRAFLAVTNGAGHVHNGMNCSTCNNGESPTRFAWFPQYSGLPESQIVEDAGERACTTCYPSAPVGVLSRPTKFFSEDEVVKAKAREEREAKRAAADAEKIVVEGIADGSHLRTQTKTFKTLRAATQFAASARADVITWGGSHPSVPLWEGDAAKVEAAIAAKTGRDVEEVTAEIKAKAVVTAKRRG